MDDPVVYDEDKVDPAEVFAGWLVKDRCFDDRTPCRGVFAPVQEAELERILRSVEPRGATIIPFKTGTA